MFLKINKWTPRGRVLIIHTYNRALMMMTQNHFTESQPYQKQQHGARTSRSARDGVPGVTPGSTAPTAQLRQPSWRASSTGRACPVLHLTQAAMSAPRLLRVRPSMPDLRLGIPHLHPHPFLSETPAPPLKLWARCPARPVLRARTSVSHSDLLIANQPCDVTYLWQVIISLGFVNWEVGTIKHKLIAKKTNNKTNNKKNQLINKVTCKAQSTIQTEIIVFSSLLT